MCGVFVYCSGGVLAGGCGGWVLAQVTEPQCGLVTWLQEVIVDHVRDKVTTQTDIVRNFLADYAVYAR